MGAHLGGATQGEIRALASFAKDLGLAFQITDGVIDAAGDPLRAGKPVRRDAPRVSFVTLCGVEGARRLAGDLAEAAVAALDIFGGRGERLRLFARHVAARDR